MRMTWRERLADWISGGALKRARMVAESNDWIYAQWKDEVRSVCQWSGLAAVRGYALRDIAAMETPNANGTVKRMARRAREALE